MCGSSTNSEVAGRILDFIAGSGAAEISQHFSERSRGVSEEARNLEGPRP